MEIPLGNELSFYEILLVSYGILFLRETYVESRNIGICLKCAVLILIGGLVFLIIAHFGISR
ncbi:MAG: hypothetical protein ACLP05_10730 [Candidatus Kryptoniota bacterium]